MSVSLFTEEDEIAHQRTHTSRKINKNQDLGERKSYGKEMANVPVMGATQSLKGVVQLSWAVLAAKAKREINCTFIVRRTHLSLMGSPVGHVDSLFFFGGRERGEGHIFKCNFL